MSEPIMHGSSDDWNKMNPQFRTRLLIELTRLKAEFQTLRHQAVHDVSQLGEQSAEIASLKAENEELHKDYEALADEHTKLIDRNARLQAEVERLRNLGIKLESIIDPLQAEVERLRKAIMDSVEMRQRLREIEEGQPSA